MTETAIDTFIDKYDGREFDDNAPLPDSIDWARLLPPPHPVNHILSEASQRLMDHMDEHSDAELDPALNHLHADIVSLAMAIDRRAFGERTTAVKP